MKKRLSVGVQSFSRLRNEDCLYVDKTEHIYNMVSTGGVYFLARPRRFGKSLLVSTLDELFRGRKELFEGLFIYRKYYEAYLDSKVMLMAVVFSNKEMKSEIKVMSE